MEREQNATLAHEDPALTSEELDDTTNNTTSNSTTTTGGGNNTESGATRNGASKPENEDKTGNEDETVAGKDKVKPGEQDPTSQSTESGDHVAFIIEL